MRTLRSSTPTTPGSPTRGGATRAFYIGIGFIPVEELWIWGPDNSALILCKPITPPS